MSTKIWTLEKHKRHIKKMRKDIDGVDFDLIDDLLIENSKAVEKVTKKKKKTMKGGNVTFY